MAKLNSVPDTSTQRQHIGLQACWQADAMLRALHRATGDGDAEGLALLVAGLLPRLLELNSVAMAALDADSETLESLRWRLDGLDVAP